MDTYRGVIAIRRIFGGILTSLGEVELRCEEDCEDCMRNNLLMLGDAWTDKLSDTWGGEYRFDILEVELD